MSDLSIPEHVEEAATQAFEASESPFLNLRIEQALIAALKAWGAWEQSERETGLRYLALPAWPGVSGSP